MSTNSDETVVEPSSKRLRSLSPRNQVDDMARLEKVEEYLRFFPCKEEVRDEDDDAVRLEKDSSVGGMEVSGFDICCFRAETSEKMLAENICKYVDASPFASEWSVKQQQGTVSAGLSDCVACCPSYGLISMMGRQRKMADATVAIPYLITLPFNAEGNCPAPSCSNFAAFHFFGVFNGDGDAQAAGYYKERLREIVAEEIMLATSCSQHDAGGLPSIEWSKVIASAFQQVDAEIMEGLRSQGTAGQKEENGLKRRGTTSAVALLCPNEIVIAYTGGNSGVVLIMGEKGVELSGAHKAQPERTNGTEEIEVTGGHAISGNGVSIVVVFTTTRAIGESCMKPSINTDLKVITIHRSQGDECLIIASDGLWDKLSVELVCEVARKCLSWQRLEKVGCYHEEMEETPAQTAAALLVKLALARGGRNNISVVVVDLKDKNKGK